MLGLVFGFVFPLGLVDLVLFVGVSFFFYLVGMVFGFGWVLCLSCLGLFVSGCFVWVSCRVGGVCKGWVVGFA